MGIANIISIFIVTNQIFETFNSPISKTSQSVFVFNISNSFWSVGIHGAVTLILSSSAVPNSFLVLEFFLSNLSYLLLLVILALFLNQVCFLLIIFNRFYI